MRTVSIGKYKYHNTNNDVMFFSLANKSNGIVMLGSDIIDLRRTKTEHYSMRTYISK